MAKLKDILPENKPSVVTILEFSGEKQGKFGPQFQYEIQYNGVAYTHYATPIENEKLSLIGLGNQAQATKKLNSYGNHSIFWSVDGDIENSIATHPVAMTNTAVATAKKHQEAYQVDKEKEAVSKILFGYMNTMLSLGKTPAEAAETAKEAYRLQVQAVSEITLGITLPKSDVDANDLPF